ncbi:hypothetical protein [Amycolatopsis sp. lyj-112]|uniref:hypothetical protein n=1 Tax=Amycolatopsis sp. lyj-112 TaxID=2789288 RepID=UPI00397DDBC5
MCTGPATGALCPQCRAARATFGGGLADLVVPLAYAKSRMSPTHQSEHHVYGYKRLPAAPKCERDLRLMVRVGGLLHGACIASSVGAWDVVTFVPSAKRPGPEHPSAGLARQIADLNPAARRVRLSIGPGFDMEPSRSPRLDRFTLEPEFRPAVRGRHALIVDDTWVSGDKAQSASLALKTFGAEQVTVLCVARWLRHNWEDHRRLIEDLRDPYDALCCPVTGSACPASG